MSSERFLRLERVFAEARGLPADARTALVARAFPDDESLRRDALRLLAADDASDEFLCEPALQRMAQSMASEGWSLREGERIGAYTIRTLLGAGGSGEVWRATDERLGREVAIKVLLPHVSGDPERLRRFADEARTAGALNHSNILTVYDVGEHRGTPFLVSECLEGQSLRMRIAAGPLSVDETIAVALAVARGLGAAHARGIIHRDLKPENVFIRSDGGVKILDFGLAKLQSAFEDPTAAAENHTVTGVIVGTAGYMAPEQIRNGPVDARTDLFALGVVLHEMLAGRSPFRRASTFETLHAVLTDEPPDLLTLNERVPAPVAAIVTRLLQKAPEARFQSAIDLAWALGHAGPRRILPASDPRIPAQPAPWWRSATVMWLAAPALVVLALFGASAVWRRAPDRTAVPSLTHFTLPLPAGMFLDSAPVVSPDGRNIAFAGTDGTESQLFVRALSSRDATVIAGTRGARQPFWSPDGRSIGYFDGRGLAKVDWAGGAPVAIADALEPRGGAWGASGDIVFAPDVILSGLRRVSAGGGPAVPATMLEVSSGDNGHWWPQFLPDGVHIIYYVYSTDDRRRGVYLDRIDRASGSASSDRGRLLFQSDSPAVYAPIPGASDGLLLYVAGGRLEARRFDTKTLSVPAEARALGLPAGANTLYYPVMLSASSDVLALSDSTVPSGNRLEAVARDGTRMRLWDVAESQHWPRLSPDGARLARQRVDGLRNQPDIWVEDLKRGTSVRITNSLEPDLQPVWSPDGGSIAFVSGNLPGREGGRSLKIAAADGTGVSRTLPCPGAYCEPTDWNHDGATLLVNVHDGRQWDVWALPAGGAQARPVLAEPFDEREARFSPDGRWIAYVSSESGRPEISVRKFSSPTTRVVISPAGGDQPVWRRDGGELLFVDPQGRLNAAAVHWTKNGTPAFGLPALLDVPLVGYGHWGTNYDVSADGRGVYMLRRNTDRGPAEIHVVLGWRALLQ